MGFVISSPSMPSKRDRRKLRWYQQEAYEQFKAKRSAFLAMEMRLGKSVVALRLAFEAWGCSRVFIFAPKIVLLGWEEELQREGIPTHNLVGISNADRCSIISSGGRGAFLINYEAVIDRGVSSALESPSGKCDCYILDESPTVKNAGSATSQFFLRSSDAVKYKILLSGLPTPEDWSDIWSQEAILNDGSWMGTSSYWKWMNHCATKDTYGHFFTPKQAVAVREEFRKTAYCMSRKDAGLGEVKIRKILSLPLPPESRRIYEGIIKDWEVPGLDQSATETNYAMVVTSWLHRLCGGYLPGGECPSWKYDELVRLLSTELRKEKAVVWYAFNDEISRSYGALRSKRKCRILSGGTSQEDRKQFIADFRTGKCDTLLVQQQLGRFGLDLSCSNVSIHFSSRHDLQSRAQCEDRIVMPGKKDPYLYIDFLSKDTIEEQIYHDLRDKKVDAKWLVARVRKMDVDRPGSRRHGMGALEQRKPLRKQLDKAKT